MRASRLLALPLLLTWISCSKNEDVEEAQERVVDPLSIKIEDPVLLGGKELWIEYCAECHVRGLGGAPKIASYSDWEPRLAQGTDVLYQHAIDGYEGPLMNEMPPKGGHDELTEEQVKQAVDFLVYAVSQTKN